jgi:benzoyl-CoA reductase/2-hydroxyglutaryl-CoA dehydratase subunit BcrC/BadD/HgdB
LEDRLKRLIEGNSEANRTKWAMEWKKQGKKIIGIMCSYVPEEVIYAAGMLPWRITGTWRENIEHARAYRSDSLCSYCNHVLESFLSRELDFLDGVVISDIDQDLLRTWDVFKYLNLTPLCHIMHVPFIDREISYKFFTEEIKKLINNIENFLGLKITEDSLRSSIDTYNNMRILLNRMYELRKREIPPLSGAEVLGITTTAQVMPKEEFNRELEMLLPYLEKRKTNLNQVHPRLLLSSDMLDNPAYLELIEENCLVAMDDMDTGSRYFIQTVDNTLEDPAYALAKRYISRHGAPRMANWDSQIKQIIKWVEDFNIDGVLSLPITWCYPQQYRIPWLGKKLEEAGIPNISLDREYHLSNVGQLSTRIGAFLEILNDKRSIINSK